jgi:hypothetical protein
MTQNGKRKKKKRHRQSPAVAQSSAFVDGGTRIREAHNPERNSQKVSDSRNEPLGESEMSKTARVSKEVKSKRESPSLMLGEGRDWLTTFVGALVSLAVFILYYLTAARDLIAGDRPELLIAAKTRGVAHAPGYPLLTILGHMFS